MVQLGASTRGIGARVRAKARRTAVNIARGTPVERPARAGLARYRASRVTATATGPEERLWRSIKGEVVQATAGTGPVVVGPWLSEVGFEVLYWVPFLRWLRDRFDIDPGRLHVVSRGGTASWYDGIADHYADVFDFMAPDAFRAHTEARWEDVGGQKQMELNKWDKAILKAAGDRLEWRRRATLHPSLMYRFFREFWRGAGPIRHVLKHTNLARMTPPEGGKWADRLPDEFVAVKFYFRPSFPDLPTNRRVVQRVVQNLAAHTNVVLLNTGLNVDDHEDVDPGVQDRVTRFLDGVPANENLHVQSLAISRAKAFVGTYGGLSYLAPFYGVRSVAYYSEGEHFLPAHLDFARRAAYHTGGSITTISSRGSGLLDRLGSTAAAEVAS
jgi:hypothetical protein